MTIAEPMTLLTDYLLAGFTAYFAFALSRHPRARWWAGAFLSLALAALVGGTYHGFPQFFPGLLWSATEVLAGLASFMIVVATARATGYFPRAIFCLAALKLLVYLVWILDHDEFIAVVIDSGIALLVVALLHAIRGDAPWRWMIAAVAVSVAAAGVQAMRLAPHPHFNHNDLYHVIQIAAMYLFYRGARLI